MLVGRRFKAAYGERVYTAIAFAMNEDFGRVLQRQMDVYNSNSADQFAAVQKKLEDVKHVMVTPHTHTQWHIMHVMVTPHTHTDIPCHTRSGAGK
jgi:3-dehydroquinate dehydratase